MDSKLFSFITASFTSLIWTSLPSVVDTVLLFICACLFIIRKYPIVGCFLLGIVWMASVGHWQYSLQLSSKQTRQPVQIIGIVSSLVTTKKDIRFNIDVSQIDGKPLWFSKRFRLSWRDPVWQVQQGQEVRLLVKVKPPHGLANEAGFHYQQWLFSQGIIATGYVKPAVENDLLANVTSVRQTLLNKMLDFELPHSAWLAALTFGYRGLLQSEDWHLVQKSGVAHLIAISGLHLALVASVSYVVIAWMLGGIVSRFDSLHHINLHKTAMILTVFTTLAYSALAGFGLPTLRAWIMLFMFSGFFLCYQFLGAQRLILLGLFSFILLFPLSIFGLSFWLSFSAVIIICFVFWRWPLKNAGFSLLAMVSGMVKVQLCLTLLMLPLVAWQFSYLSVVSPLVNLVAVPVVTVLLVPLCLLAVIGLAITPDWSQDVFSLADRVISYGLAFIDSVLTLKGAYLSLPMFSAWAWLYVFLLIVACCLPSFWFSRKYLCLMLLPLASFWMMPRSTAWQIDVLDVGQGVSVLISKNKRAIIYDVGPRYPSGFNMADSVLLPILQGRGISEVDLVFISHGDNDHAGSLPQLEQGVQVREVLTNQNTCQQGLDTRWQGLKIKALWPDNPSQHNDNNGSCVLRVSDQYHSIVLPGDIDKSIEKILVDLYPEQLQGDILLAPHHGSNTSSSSEFIQAVNPEYVVFSQGFMNRWRFPRPEVLDRYKQLSQGRDVASHFFSTSVSGQVSFILQYDSPETIQVKTFRQDTYPYWYANVTSSK